jgi:hypothetical protein
MRIEDELYCIYEDRLIIKNIRTPMPLFIVKNFTLTAAFVVAFLAYSISKIITLI